MSLNEILSIAIFAMLLIDVVMLGFALYYRNQVKALKEEIQSLRERIKKINTDFILGDRNIIYECDGDIRKYDAYIARLEQKIEEYDETFQQKNEIIDDLKAKIQSRDEEIEKLNQQNELNPEDGTEVQSRDEEIDLLKRKLDAYDETFGKNIKSMYELIAEIQSRDEEIETLKDELKQRDEEIEKLKDEHKEALERKDIALCCQFEENISLNKKIEKLTQELKQRDASVKEKSQKNKKKSK
ncbi:hypothetical protein [Bartonella mastomydis]|uniref:hypothetical protein n=1 Tax=Bartonella mastomydis TaxID=1820002 RepID=UPI0011163FA4|nr:hypothetical protein [Bartonella mastomydis]